MLELLSRPWHWSASGVAIAAVMFALLAAGKEFGVSSNLRTMCTLAGAGRRYGFFDVDWRAQRWNLLFAAGAVLGGAIGVYALPSPEPVAISAETVAFLASIDVAAPTTAEPAYRYVPPELFAPSALLSARGLVFLVLGGFLIGFGTRWAGGCTSGHAISGLSNLQLPSLIAVVGFFLGGLLVTWLVLPLLPSLPQV